jgi:hypothetical protein
MGKSVAEGASTWDSYQVWIDADAGHATKQDSQHHGRQPQPVTPDRNLLFHFIFRGCV